MTAERLRKVALVGVDAGPGESDSLRWACFAWDTPRSSVNLHDYDAWVLFMPGLPAQMKSDGLYRVLTVDYVWESLISGTRVLVVGDPRVSANVAGWPSRPFLHWTGYDFQWKSTGGDTIDVADASYKYGIEDYLHRIKGWDYALREMTKLDGFDDVRFVRAAKADREWLGLVATSLAQNRNSELISAALQLTQYTGDGRLKSIHESVVLVPFGRLEPMEALSAVLTEAFGISIRQQAPAWAEQFVAPRQAAVVAAISEIRGDITTREAALQLKLQERTEVRNCLDVLFQIGTPLEDAVERLLGELGAMVERPGTTVDCDRYFSIEIDGLTRRAALEIKGTSKPQFDMKGFKQVLQWRDEAMIARGEEHRAVFIGNSDAEATPESRASPFGDGWRKQTKLHKVTALTTQTLYQAYCAKAEGKLKIEEFWELLFSTDGIFELRDALLQT